MSAESVLVLLLVAVAVLVAVHWLAGRTGLPGSAVLTLVGAGYTLLPGPVLPLDPQVILTFVLPPLLYSAALDSSLLAIRRNLRTVVSLSVLLVLATAVTVGAGIALFVGGAGLAAGIALGAAVAPPDPVAALAAARRVALPPRIITLIQGEGLLNDATALTLLTVAVSAAVGNAFSAPRALGLFLLEALGGAATGLAVAYGVRPLRRLRRDPLSSNAISLATPFGAYLLGQALHVSGVLAVVVAGLVVGHNRPYWASGASRLQTDAVWRLVDFLLEGFVFLLIGQQLPAVVSGLGRYDTGTVAAAVAVTLVAVLGVRPLWLVLTQSLPRSLHSRLGGQDGGRGHGGGSRDQPLTGREVAVLSWAGTRGVITLAAIATLPLTTRAGTPFPHRNLLVFCAFVVVLVTLVGQGVTFAPLVRRLGVHADRADAARVRNEARLAAIDAATDRLEELRAESRDDVEEQVLDGLRPQLIARRTRYQRQLDALAGADTGELPLSPHYEAGIRLRRALIEAQRTELLRWRDLGRLPDEGLRVLERELDHEEGLLPVRRAS